MASESILLIEDDTQIAELVELHLRDSGYLVERASDGEAGLKKALEGDYRLVILDIMLPLKDGTEVCRSLREKNKSIPILMLTAKSEELDKVLGLELGADDYVTKPFSIRELLARVKALLRRFEIIESRGEETEKREIQIGDLTIDRKRREVQVEDRRVALTAKEFDLLVFLASSPGRTYSRGDLLNSVWGYQYSGYEHTVNSHINRLRSKIESDASAAQYIQTVWGVGYRFAEPEDFEK